MSVSIAQDDNNDKDNQDGDSNTCNEGHGGWFPFCSSFMARIATGDDRIL